MPEREKGPNGWSYRSTETGYVDGENISMYVSHLYSPLAFKDGEVCEFCYLHYDLVIGLEDTIHDAVIELSHQGNHAIYKAPHP